MKFTKEDARKELMSKIPNKGQTLNLSERSIDEMLETLMTSLANDETEMNDFIEAALPIFRTADGNIKNDVSVGISKYKEANPPIDPKKGNGKKTEQPLDDANQKLLERLEALERELEENKKTKQVENKKKQLVEEMKKKGIKDDEWIENFLSEVSVTEDVDVEAKATHYVEFYNKMNAQVTRNATPGGTGGSTSEKELSDFIKGASDFVKSQRLE